MKSSKQLSLIGAAVAAALGTSAYALGPASWTNGDISSANIYYDGGGSNDVQAVYVAVLQCLTASTVDVYTDGTGSTKHPQSQSYLILSGTTNGACGASGTNIGFFYKYNGGAFPNGIQPQLASGSTLLAYPTTTSLATAGLQSGFSGTVSSVNPDYTFSPTLGPATIQPDWGISDGEGSLFAYFDNANNSGVLPGSIPNGPVGLWVAPYGIAVTANVYAQKTKWTKAEIASIYQGKANYKITTWAKLIADNGSPMTLAGGIALLDRGSGAAAKAAANNYFLGYPNSTFAIGGALGPYSSNGSTNANANYTGSALVTSGAATTAFQDIKEGSSVSITDDLNNAQNAGIGAIAALGLEFPPLFEQTTAGTNSYYFVAINGVWPDTQTGTTDNVNSPTAATTHYTNVVNGSYDFAVQVGLQYKNPIPAGFEAGVVANLESATISGANTGSPFPASAEGVLLDPATTGTTAAGNVWWTRGGNTPASAVSVGIVSPAAAVPIASQ